MNVLVTGGSGFIGSHVVDLLVEEGHDVVVVDRVAPSHPNPAATFVQADLVNANEWVDVLDGIDAVSHQAARVGLGLRFDDVTDYVRDNDLATAVLLQELARIRFAGRLVLASSMVVYGEGSYSCPSCGQVRPGPRSPSRPRSWRVRAGMPSVRVGPVVDHSRRGNLLRPTQHLRRHKSSPGTPLLDVRSRDRGPRHHTAVPQRVRAPGSD